jgi:hypothetical protein
MSTGPLPFFRCKELDSEAALYAANRCGRVKAGMAIVAARVADTVQRQVDTDFLRFRSTPGRHPADWPRQDRKKRFYKRVIPVADRLYDEQIEELQQEGLIP